MITTAFDPLFRRYGGGIPLNYLRALSKRESNMNPAESRDPAWGLMQIVPVARESYNRRYGTNYTKQDLLDPEVNVRIGTDLLKRIVASYQANHPDVPNLRPNWRNPEFVSLVTAGWNSGYSERAGVGAVARWLKRQGLPVTHANVFRHARQAGATRHLANPTKENWQRSVTNLFYAEGGPTLAGYGIMGVALAVGAAYLVYRLL
jgi:hypothetical protein